MTQKLEYLPLQQTMPLLNPQYPPQYYQKFTQLKKHMQLKIFDAKANELAQQLIPYGQTNYNCWYVKKMCFMAGVVTYQHQMQFSQKTLYQKIKNFQLWQHRRFLLDYRKNYAQQYTLINTILQLQPKNYHAWSHRVWVFDQVKNYQQQIQYTQKMLQQDPYNNSVWAYRSHLINKIVQQQKDKKEQQKMIYVELSQCLIFIQKHLDNQAAWNYLRGYFPSIKLKTIPCQNKHTVKLPRCQMIENRIIQFIKVKLEQLKKIFESQNYVPKHSQILAEIQLLITLTVIQSQKQDTQQYARNTCLLLAQKDAQKRYYWKWVSINI